MKLVLHEERPVRGRERSTRDQRVAATFGSRAERKVACGGTEAPVRPTKTYAMSMTQEVKAAEKVGEALVLAQLGELCPQLKQ